MARERLRICFIVEQALGHVTHAQNLKNWVDRDADVDATWIWVPYQAPDIWERLPWLPFSMKLSLRARRVVRQTLARQPLDCLYFHTQALALFSLDLMKALPAVISLDATPEGFKTRFAEPVVRVMVEGPEGRETLSIRLDEEDGRALLAERIRLGQVVSIHSDSTSLKDVFLKLTGREFR